MSHDPEEVALVRACVAAPDDDTPRLVYADWLDDHGRPERARLIRVQCQIEQLRAEERSLIDRFGRQWAGPVIAAGGDDWAFHRGFPEEVTMRLADFFDAHEALNDVTPLCRVRLLVPLGPPAECDAALTGLAALPVARQFRALELGTPSRLPTPPTYGSDGVRALAAAPNLAGLRELALHSHGVGADGIAALAASPHLTRLTRLTVTDPAVGADEHCLLRLVRSPELPNLAVAALGGHPPASVHNIRALADARPGTAVRLDRL